MNNEKIIITKTPLRISFIGGGTDMPYFYEKNGGATISCAINKYVYVTVKFHNNYQEKYRLNYSQTESVNHIDQIKNLRIRLVLKKLGIKKPLYINTFADLPANSGLGSSSSFTVGLIKALAKLDDRYLTLHQIAEMAYKVEARITNNVLGKQDHYIASYGGLNYIKYLKNKILVTPINLSRNTFKAFEKSIALVWTGKIRSSEKILQDQRRNLKKNLEGLKKINILCEEFKKQIQKKNMNIEKLGQIIDSSWVLKKSFSKFVTDKKINFLYNNILNQGSYGGKLLGAGNGGFILSLSSQLAVKNIKRKLKKNRLLQVKIDKLGSVIL
jgi:D-glycero-alpha-D-manno-heptose-7-phosphate kinase